MACDHVLWVHSRCHPDADVSIACCPGSDRLLVVCARCGETVAVYRLAEPIPRTATCSTCAGIPPRERMS